MLWRRDAEAGVERSIDEPSRPLDEAGERGGELAAGTGRAGERDEVEPAVGLLASEADALVRRRRGDELDAPEVGAIAGGDVDDDDAGGARSSRVGWKAIPAVRLEDGRIRHRHDRGVRDELVHAGEHLEALPRAHAAGERPL